MFKFRPLLGWMTWDPKMKQKQIRQMVDKNEEDDERISKENKMKKGEES